MKIRTRKLLDNILVLTFETNYELAMSFVRLQEFYESPKYKGKVFSLEDYIDYWSAEFGKGVFDYPTRWHGFNIPGPVVLDWMEKFGYDSGEGIREKEKELIKKILSRFSREELENCYIIGVAKDSAKKKHIIDHEVAHAMYMTNPQYRLSCQQILTKLHRTDIGKVLYDRMEDKLIKMGYCKDVVEDEMQAYWSVPENKDSYLESQFEELRELKANYKMYRKGSK